MLRTFLRCFAASISSTLRQVVTHTDLNAEEAELLARRKEADGRGA
jgi:hypothetical protein